MQIGLDHTRIDLRPGRPARLAVELHNDRPTAGMFTLSVDLPGTAWLTSSQPVVRVSHAETVVTTVEVHVGNDVVAGEHDAVLRANSVSDPDDVAVHRLRLVVGPAPSMRLVVAPSVVAGHVGASTTATVTNTGNTPLEVQYATRDPAGETQSRLSITHSRLLAGERRDVDVTITAPSARLLLGSNGLGLRPKRCGKPAWRRNPVSGSILLAFPKHILQALVSAIPASSVPSIWHSILNIAP